MKNLLALVAALATTLGTAAAQGTPSSAGGNGPAKVSASASSKPATKPNKVVTSSGGQGHNSGPDPKGKTLVAPTTTQKGKPAHN